MLPHAASPRRAHFGAGAAYLLATLTGFAHAAEKSPADTTKPVMFLRDGIWCGPEMSDEQKRRFGRA